MNDRARQQLNSIETAEAATLERCKRSGTMDGYVWHATGRRPPLPFWEAASEPGRCRVCGQQINDANGQRHKRLTWHHDCTSAYFLWTKPSDYAAALIWRQGGVCPISGDKLGPPAQEYVLSCEVDHEVPIYRVRRDMHTMPWFELLRFWGLTNLRAITPKVHSDKSAREAKERAGWRSPQGALPLDDTPPATA